MKSSSIENMIRILLLATITASGCSPGYKAVLTRYKEAPICCKSLKDVAYEGINVGDSKIFDISGNSPAFQFDTGKSFFKAFTLPTYTKPYKIHIQSYMGGDNINEAHIFVPKLIFLNEKYDIVRASDPLIFHLEKTALSETWGLRFKLEGYVDVSEANRNEKYFIVMTTDELLLGKVSISASRTVPIILSGVFLPIPIGEREILVPNSPSGKVRVALETSQALDTIAQVTTAVLFTVPAITMDKQVGDLVLGRTTLKQALEILPAFPGYPPQPLDSRLKPEHVGKVREVLSRAKVGYNPMWSPHILIFDKYSKLVIVQRNFSGAHEEGNKIYEKHKNQLKEVAKLSKDSHFPHSRLQGEITECITMEVILNELGEVNDVGYIYTCPAD